MSENKIFQSAIFHSYCAAEEFVKNHNIKEYEIYYDKTSSIPTATLHYFIEPEEPKEPEEPEKSSDIREFIIGALVGYLEDKKYRSRELESIAGAVAQYFDDIEWVEIY